MQVWDMPNFTEIDPNHNYFKNVDGKISYVMFRHNHNMGFYKTRDFIARTSVDRVNLKFATRSCSNYNSGK